MSIDHLTEPERKAYTELMEIVEEAALLGQRRCTDGTRWIGHTPHRAPAAYLHQIYSPLSDEEIEFLQDQVEYDFPDSLYRFLRIHNGIGIFACHVNIYGLRRNWNRTDFELAAQQPFTMISPNTLERPKDAPDEMLFVGSLGEDRRKVAMLPNGQLQLWNDNQISGEQHIYADVFDFLLTEARSAHFLFDKNGRRRESHRPSSGTPGLTH